MSAKKTGLGRGFDSLIPTDVFDESFDPTVDDATTSDLRQIKLSEIQPDPGQPRRRFDETALTELAESISVHGVLQPIVVSPAKQGYRIVAGERRYRAAKQAGLQKIPALVRTVSDQHRLELGIIENVQRRDLNPIETALAYQKLRDQFNLSLEAIGKRVGGKSVSAVSNTLRLLKLPEAVREAVAAGKVSEGLVRPLIGQNEATVAVVLPKLISGEWTARAVESYIAGLKRKAQPVSTDGVLPTYQTQTTQLQKRFGAKVAITSNARGAGKIVISFKDKGDFERIEKLLSD